MAAFSSDAQRCIEQHVEITNIRPTAKDELCQTYELDRCDAWIKANKLSKVCLQFPDNLLCDAPDIALSLQLSSAAQCFILGDTSYGSCCVDEVSAEHVNSDGIIHFGHACLSPTRRLPVLYIFQAKSLDALKLLDAVKIRFEDNTAKILFIYDVAYSHKIKEVQELLSHQYLNVVSAYPNLNNNQDQQKTCLGCLYQLPDGDVLQDYNIIFIGKDGRTFTNYILELEGCKILRYDPEEPLPVIQSSEMSVSRFLMKRLHLVEKVKDASTLGILIGTLGVDGYLDAVDRIKLLAKGAGKKTYIIAVGRPNVPKLANFPEVNVFVLVACPENSLLDWKEFYQPVVSLYEVEMACNSARQWSSKYITDFRQLLSGGVDHVQFSELSREDQVDVSLISGKVRSMCISNPVFHDSEDKSLANRADLSVCVSTGSQFLANRSWQGLEQNLGQTPVELASKGRSGIASSYESEPIQKDSA